MTHIDGEGLLMQELLQTEAIQSELTVKRLMQIHCFYFKKKEKSHSKHHV